MEDDYDGGVANVGLPQVFSAEKGININYTRSFKNIPLSSSKLFPLVFLAILCFTFLDNCTLVICFCIWLLTLLDI